LMKIETPSPSVSPDPCPIKGVEGKNISVLNGVYSLFFINLLDCTLFFWGIIKSA